MLKSRVLVSGALCGGVATKLNLESPAVATRGDRAPRLKRRACALYDMTGRP